MDGEKRCTLKEPYQRLPFDGHVQVGDDADTRRFLEQESDKKETNERCE